jgi:hypothetical protein
MPTTITFYEPNNGWTTEWNYQPHAMCNVDNRFYSIKDGNLYQFRVFFESNFNLTALAYEISSNGINNWSTPTLINIINPQEFNPDSGIITYSNVYLYTDPVTSTTTTTTTEPVGEFYMIQISNGSSNPSNMCSFSMNNNKFIYTTQPNLGQYPLEGDIVCNTANLNDRFIGNNLYYRMVYSIADVNQSSIVARVDNNGLVYNPNEICPAQINP